MPRKPLPIGSWGTITRTPMLREQGREIALVSRGRSYFLPQDMENSVRPSSWVARAKFRDQDGVTRRVECWAPTAGRAEHDLLEKLTNRKQMIGGEFSSESRLRELGDHWWRTVVDGSTLAPRTQDRYFEIWEGYVRPSIGGLLLRECTTRAMDRYLQNEAKEHGVGIAKLCKTVLSGIFKIAARDDCIAANPIPSVGDFSRWEKSKEPLKVLTSDQLKQIREALRRDDHARSLNLDVMADLMLATGCRIGEALALRWDADLNLDSGTVTIGGTVVRSKRLGLHRQEFTKGKSVTLVKLPDWILPRLEAHREAVTWVGDLNLVFPSEASTLREPDNLQGQWRAFKERNLGLPAFTPHSFRKAVATAVNRGADSHLAAELLGHSSDKITRDYYIERDVEVVDATNHLANFGF